MYQSNKEKVRHWTTKEVKKHKPAPDPKQLRRELGWDLLEAERKVYERSLK